MAKNLEKRLIDSWENLPQSQERKNDFEKTIEFRENWTVILPWVTLRNPSEALRYVREQEKMIVSKMRESNEYVVNEVKEMLEDAFNWWYHSDNNRPKERRGGEKSAVCSDYDYESDKISFVEWPIKFLSEYEWSLQNFMDLVVEELKWREFWWWDNFNVMCKRFWVSKDELMKLDTVSFIEKMKKDIKNIPQLSPTTCANDMNEHLWAASFYLFAIKNACEKLWYKR